jgi:glutathione S-transferase
VPAQPVAEARRLGAAFFGEMAMRVAKLEGFVDRRRVPDQEHLHVFTLSRMVARMKLYGTSTSPFVRRVRVVAAEVGEPIDFVVARPPDSAELRAVSAINKVPVAVFGERTIFDSRAIIDWLVLTRGWGHLAPPRDHWHASNLINAIDEALESVIQVFYLQRDGVDPRAFGERQLARADAIFTWLGTQGLGEQLGLPEISLICALDWMDFRHTYDTGRAKGIAHVRARWQDHPSMAATKPKE